MSLPYNRLAAIYDGLMGDVDHKQWAGYLEQLSRQYGAPGPRLLDLGCGTGTLTLLLAEAGFDVVGADLSSDMLAVAADKGLAVNLSPSRWRCQDMRELRFPRASFDLVTCACDGFNYLRSPAELGQTLQGIASCLKPEGLLLFDLHSEHKMRQVFSGGQFVQESADGYCIWTSEFDEQTGDCLHEMTIFSRHRGDLYLRSDESHHQHYFSPEDVAALLQQTGFSLLRVLAWGTEAPLTPVDERIQFVARRQADNGGLLGG